VNAKAEGEGEKKRIIKEQGGYKETKSWKSM
jgi:hypothetical protein